MAASIYGTTPVSHANVTSTMRYYVDPNLYMEDANEYPWLTYLLQQGIHVGGDWEWKHHTKSFLPIHSTIDKSAGYDASVTTLAFVDTTWMRPNDVLINFNTSEAIRVNTVPSTTTITCGRGVLDSTAASITDGDYFIRSSSGARHGEAIGQFATMATTAVTNYVQKIKKLVRTNVENTGVLLTGGNPRTYEQAEKLKEWLTDFDRATILQTGDSYITGAGAGAVTGSTLGGDASTAHPLYYTHGIKGKASTYVYSNFSTGITRATLTEANWNSYLRNYVFPKARGKLLPLFCSEIIFDAIDTWGRAKLDYGPSDLLQGIACTKYQNSAGTVELFHEPQLSDVASGYGYDGCAFSVVPGNVFLTTVAGNELDLYLDVVKDGTEQYIDEWRGALGLVVKHENKISWLEGVSAAA